MLALAGCLACCLLVGRSGGILEGRWNLFALIGTWLALSAVAAACLGRVVAGPVALAVVATTAVVLQAAALTAGPQLSDDLYRYVWDARVAEQGVDPYRYPPTDPALKPLREPALWPSPGGCEQVRSQLPDGARANPFAEPRRPAGCTQINRPDVRTIYPPAAQLAFRAAAPATRAVEPVELRVQLPAAALSLLLTATLLLVLWREARSPGWALLYAGSPLAGLEAGMDAHVDVLAALLGVGLVVLLARERAALAVATVTGVLLSLAVLVKIYPAALAPVVVSRWGWRSARTWTAFSAAAAVSILLYVPHVLAVGVEVLGYLPGYLRENEYDSGGRYVLLGFLPDATASAAVLLGLSLVVARCVLCEIPAELGAVAARAAGVLGAAFLLVTPGNAWYCSLLICCALLGARPEWLMVVLASYTVYFAAILGAGTTWPTVAYALAAATAVGATLLRRRLAAGTFATAGARAGA